MKNTFKLLSCVTAGVAVLAVGQLQASAVVSSYVPNFSPLIINGTGAGTLTTTNGTTGVITYSAKNITLNTAFILQEFYASDAGNGSGFTNAAGDSLAVANKSVSPTTYVTRIPSGYLRLNNRIIITYTYIYTTNSLDGNVKYGDLVIFNAKGQVKVDLTQRNLVNNSNNNGLPYYYSMWSQSYSYNSSSLMAYLTQGSGELLFSFPFGANTETIDLFLFGGGAVTTQNPPPGDNSGYEPTGVLSVSGGGHGTLFNPTYAAVINNQVIFNETATVPYAYFNYYYFNYYW